MIRRRPRRHHDDAGASLIVAIGFMLMVGTISAGLIGLATSGLNNRVSLDIVRNRQYAADAAIESSIATRTTVLGVTAQGVCSPVTGSDSYVPFNGVAIRVDWTCAISSAPSSSGPAYPQRNIIFSACVANPVEKSCNAASVIIRFQVNFEPASGVVTKTYVQSWNVSS